MLRFAGMSKVVLYMMVSGKFPYFYFFFGEEILHTQKRIKCKQATFTQIFYSHKKHKKHKKQLLLTYFIRLINIKNTKCNKFCRRLTRNKKKINVFYSAILYT